MRQAVAAVAAWWCIGSATAFAPSFTGCSRLCLSARHPCITTLRAVLEKDRSAEVDAVKEPASVRNSTPPLINTNVVPTDVVREVQQKLTLEQAAARTKDQSVNKVVVGFLKGMLNTYYGDRHYARFYALETIARVPYFSYLSVLHLYETLGWWRQARYLKIHFAESWNELHHLLIMETLGGNDKFIDRFLAQHTAFFYYWIICIVYAISPQNAYNLNQHVEEHAYSTYDEYVKEHGDELKQLPAPQLAKDYYAQDKLYIFNGLHNSDADFEKLDKARPKVETLYDVFCCIRDDEGEHVKTMAAMQDETCTQEQSCVID